MLHATLTVNRTYGKATVLDHAKQNRFVEESLDRDADGYMPRCH